MFVLHYDIERLCRYMYTKIGGQIKNVLPVYLFLPLSIFNKWNVSIEENMPVSNSL